MGPGGLAKHRTSVVVVGLAASAVFVYLAVRRLDVAALGTVWRGAHVLPWVPLGILSYVAGHFVRGQRCRLLVRQDANLRLLTASNIVVVGYASNNVFPARLGELVRAGMLAERTGIPIAQSLMVTFIERVLDGLAILLLLVLGTMHGNVPGWTHDLVRVALLVFGGASVALLLGAHSPGLVVSGASRLGTRLGEKWHDRLVGLATSMTNAGASIRSPRDAVLLVLYSVLVWCLEAGLFLAIMPAFGLHASIAAAAVAMSVTNLGLLVPSSPGFIGPFHFFCSRAIMTTGVDEPTALAYAAVVHLAFFVPVTIWGAGAMLWYGIEVGATAAMARAARAQARATVLAGLPIHVIAQLPPARAEEEVTAFTTAMVEAVVVAEGHAAEPDALADTSRFVHGQLAALPPNLRMLFELGMTTFRVVTRLRYLKGYCELSLATRRAWVGAWASSRYALLRKLMKPLRSIALLAYYDHPSVRGALIGATVVPVSGLVRSKVPSAPEPPIPAESP